MHRKCRFVLADYLGNYTDQEVKLLKDRIRNGLVPFRLSQQSFADRSFERLHIPQYAHDNAMINAYLVQLSASDQQGKDKTALADEKIATAMMVNQLLSNRFFMSLEQKNSWICCANNCCDRSEQALFGLGTITSCQCSRAYAFADVFKRSNQWLDKLELQAFISQRDALIEQLEQPIRQ